MKPTNIFVILTKYITILFIRPAKKSEIKNYKRKYKCLNAKKIIFKEN